MADDPILYDLYQVMTTNQEVEILNHFRNYPVTCKARITAIDRGTVVFHVEPPMSVCLEGQKETILFHQIFPEALRSRILLFDLRHGELRLDDFSYAGSHFGDRKIARIQPEEDITVTLHLGERQVQGTLADISINGLGVVIENEMPGRGEECQVLIGFPGRPTSISGKIQNISQGPTGQTRLSISFTRSADESAGVIEYILEQRSKILNEVRTLYERRMDELSIDMRQP